MDLLAGTTLRDRQQYSYTAQGQLASATAGLTSTDDVQRTFTYDVRGRLTGYADHHRYADSTEGPCPDPFQIICDPPAPWEYTWHNDLVRSATYTPDASGNRTDGSASLSRDRLTSMTGADGRSYSFTYDAEGRRLTRTASGYSQSYGWDALGHLRWVKTNGDSVAYWYDAAGRRVRKDHGGTTTRYLWDGDRLVMLLNGNGSPQWEFSPGLSVDAPVAVRRSSDGKRFYYQYDGSGNVVALWDTTNTRVVTYTDDPYGYPIASTGSVAQPLRWKGREYDSETGLYYVRARYYDPTVGRFVSEDPAGLAGGINPYTFADGDPVNKSDPTGLAACVEYRFVRHAISEDKTVYTPICVVWGLDPVVTTADGGGGDEWHSLWGSQPVGVAGPGGGSHGGGSSGGNGSPTESLPRNRQACYSARANLILTVASDATFVFGFGAAVKYGVLAARSATLARMFAPSSARGLMFAARARVQTFLASGAGAAALAGYLAETDEHGLIQSPTRGLEPIGWDDFIPVWASVKAFRSTRRACRGN